MTVAGALAPEFTHVVFKSLSAVEADSTRSNQHEFNAPKSLREAFGVEQPRRIDTDFVWMPDDGDFLTEEGQLTWYDSRARHPTRSEYRLYYRNNAVTCMASANDLLLIGLRPDGRVLLVLAPGTGLAAARISWLFGIETSPGAGFAALDIDHAAQNALLSQLGTTSVAEVDMWTPASTMNAVLTDSKLRNLSAIAQHAPQSESGESGASWDDVVLSLPEAPPENLSGIALAKTIEGIVRPKVSIRSRPRCAAFCNQSGVTDYLSTLHVRMS